TRRAGGPAWTAERSSSPDVSSTCWRPSPATPGSCSAASACWSWCGATTSPSTPTSSTCSSASCAASSRPAGRRGWCTPSAASASPSSPVPDRPTRSLRTRVAVAAGLGTLLLSVVVAVVVSGLLTHREVNALDRRLDAVAQVVAARVTAGEDPGELLDRGTPLLRSSLDGLVVTVRTADGTRSVAVDGPPRTLPAGDGEAGRYRVRTVAVPQGTVTV